MGMNLRTRRRAVPQIPIVSLIDIMVILLIFFIATTTFRQSKTHMQVALPESKGMGQTSAATEERTGIIITKAQKIFLAGSEYAADKLADGLKSLKIRQPAVKLELEADNEAALGVLVKVWDALREAGFSVADVPARIQRVEE
jgi:biopolymer transport protein ExbD